MKKVIAASLTLLMLGTSTLALADPYDRDWGGPSPRGPQPGYYDRGWQGPQGGPPPRNFRGGYYGYDQPRSGYYGRNYAPARIDHRGFREGYRLPPQYLNERYYVNNWNDYRLPPPPPQQRWTYIDGRYILVAAATGIITQILLNGGR